MSKIVSVNLTDAIRFVHDTSSRRMIASGSGNHLAITTSSRLGATGISNYLRITAAFPYARDVTSAPGYQLNQVMFWSQRSQRAKTLLFTWTESKEIQDAIQSNQTDVREMQDAILLHHRSISTGAGAIKKPKTQFNQSIVLHQYRSEKKTWPNSIKS